MSIETHFNDIQTNILLELNKANRQILLAVAWLTDETLFNKLCQKADDLVDVQIIIINDEINRNSGINYEKLIKFGGKVYWQENVKTSLMHHKFCVIDSTNVITGSYNWTRRANSNIENIIILKNETQSAKQYYDEFKSLVPRFEEANFFEEGYQSAEYFNTPEKRLSWYNNLPDDVKETFTYYGRSLIWTYDEEGYVILNENLDDNIAAIFKVKELIYSNKSLIHLKHLSNLENLTIHNSQDSDMSPLKNLIRLKELRFSGNKNIINIIPFQKMKKLENLNLSNCNISSLEGIENLLKIKYLELSSNKIKSLKELSMHSKLIDLRLNDNEVYCINPISNNLSLERLEFGNNYLEDLSPLQKCLKLNNITFYNNRVNDLSKIFKLSNLKYIYPYGNPISDQEISLFIKNRKSTFICDFFRNRKSHE